jgi:hypothetical protein
MQADIKRAVDIAERAANGWVVEYTEFFTPPLVADVLANTKKLAGLEVCLSSTEWIQYHTLSCSYLVDPSAHVQFLVFSASLAL